MCSYSAHILLWLNIIGESLCFRPNSSLSFLVQTLSTPLFYLTKQLTLWVWEELLDDLWSKREKKTSCMCYYFMEFRFATLLVLLLLFIQDNEKHWNWYLGYFTLYISLTLNVLTPRPELTSFFFHCTVKHIEFVNDQCTICICFNFHISCFPVPDVSISSSWYMVRLCYVACEEWFYGFCIKNISASSKSNPW